MMCLCERLSETYTAIALYREPQRELVVNYEPKSPMLLRVFFYEPWLDYMHKRDEQPYSVWKPIFLV